LSLIYFIIWKAGLRSGFFYATKTLRRKEKNKLSGLVTSRQIKSQSFLFFFNFDYES
jgi:hypothetical protein